MAEKFGVGRQPLVCGERPGSLVFLSGSTSPLSYPTTSLYGDQLPWFAQDPLAGALKVLHPGKLLSRGQTGAVGQPTSITFSEL